MSAELPANQSNQSMPPAEQADMPLFPVTAAERAQQIADTRQEAAATKMAELMEDPRIMTLLETGQLTTGDALAREQASGTTELPKVRSPKRKPANRRGGRSYNEGSDSERDPHWNAPAPEITPAKLEKGRAAAEAVTETLKHDSALAEYWRNVDELGVSQALGLLRGKGYIPDPDTRGNSLIRIGEERQHFVDRRPPRR